MTGNDRQKEDDCKINRKLTYKVEDSHKQCDKKTEYDHKEPQRHPGGDATRQP